jgi:hypothetical protein
MICATPNSTYPVTPSNRYQKYGDQQMMGEVVMMKLLFQRPFREYLGAVGDVL